MAICIYAPDATDFSTNGLGTLTPISCTVEEESGGMYELELVQPIDDTLRWAQLARGCIIKAPVPVRESPLYEETDDAAGSEIRERVIYKVYNTSVGVYMREGPGASYKNYGYLKNGAEVVLLDVYNASWYHVCVVNGGRVCYIASKYLTYSRSDGNYYTIDVDAGGNVTATAATVSDEEITAGQTDGGRVILETNITAANLNTSNLLATYALINKIDAARIDVAELFAQSAFVDALYTSKIYGGKSIEMIVGQVDETDLIADSAKAEANAVARDLERRMRLDAEGLHVGDNQSDSALLLQSGEIHFVIGGNRVSTIAPDYHRFGNMEIRKPSVGGIVIQAVQE